MLPSKAGARAGRERARDRELNSRIKRLNLMPSTCLVAIRKTKLATLRHSLGRLKWGRTLQAGPAGPAQGHCCTPAQAY
jgi:hypothetical protein